jgi:hypothetical protein
LSLKMMNLPQDAYFHTTTNFDNDKLDYFARPCYQHSFRSHSAPKFTSRSAPTTEACYDFPSSSTLKKPQGGNLKCQIFWQHFFKIVLYWCLDLIRHNIGTKLKLNKYIFDISIPFCHHLYLSAI